MSASRPKPEVVQRGVDPGWLNLFDKGSLATWRTHQYSGFGGGTPVNNFSLANNGGVRRASPVELDIPPRYLLSRSRNPQMAGRKK